MRGRERLYRPGAASWWQQGLGERVRYRLARPEAFCAANSPRGSSGSVCSMVRRSASITAGQGVSLMLSRRSGRSDEPGGEVPVVALQGLGQLRTPTRTLATLDLAPPQILTRLDQITTDLTDEETSATCIYSVHDPSSRD